MASKASKSKQRPLTPDDLKSLVQGLGAMVRDSVREEVSDQIRPLCRDLERLEGCNRDLQKLLNEALTLERQRLAKERDVEHRRFLSGADLARHPGRDGATKEQLRDAALVSTAFVAGMDSQRQVDATRPPSSVDAEVVVDGTPLPMLGLPEGSST